jgi:hypothetical protein
MRLQVSSGTSPERCIFLFRHELKERLDFILSTLMPRDISVEEGHVLAINLHQN